MTVLLEPVVLLFRIARAPPRTVSTAGWRAHRPSPAPVSDRRYAYNPPAVAPHCTRIHCEEPLLPAAVVANVPRRCVGERRVSRK
jgi:hypothetical protein